MISILIPVYNTKPDFLIKCINSCLSQTIDDYEIVIVDNGSTDNETIGVLTECSKESKINIYNCAQQEGKNNISIALNMGLRNCNHNLVARMDSDDIMFHDRLERQLDYMNKNPEVDILGAQIRVFPDNYTTNHPKVITKEMGVNSSWFINHPSVMYKKDKILSIGGYKDTPEHAAEDYGLWMNALRNKMVIRNMKETVLLYRSHGENLTRKREKHNSYYESIKIEQDKTRQTI